MRLLLTLLLIVPILLTPVYGVASVPVPDALTVDASGAAARSWSNATKRCGMMRKGQQTSGRCVVELMAILSSVSAVTPKDRSFNKPAADAGWQPLAPRPLTKPPRA